MNKTENAVRKDGYNQVVVWQGTVVGENKVKEFEKFMLDNLKVSVQYLEEIETGPDIENNQPVRDTGGRNDVFFAVKDTDMTGTFAIKRLQWGVRWIEDVLAEGNYTSRIYPERVFGYCSWNKENLAKEKEKKKPKCQLVGEDGNIFFLIEKASKTLKKAGMREEAKEMAEKVMESSNYHEALAIIGEYVEIY